MDDGARKVVRGVTSVAGSPQRHAGGHGLAPCLSSVHGLTEAGKNVRGIS